MATLKILCNFEILTDGETITGKQGSASDAAKTAFEATVTGDIHRDQNSLAAGSARTVYDDDNDTPATPVFMFFWADQDCYLQMIGSSTNAQVNVRAKVPFIMSSGTRGNAPTTGLAFTTAATTTAISGTEPTLEDLDSVVIQNNVSATTMRYKFVLVA